jgi:hypothetical protein
VLENPKPLPELEPKELENVITHVEKEVKGGDLPTLLRCKVALRFDDQAALDKCSAAMSTAPVNDPAVISIKWGLAVRKHDRAGALALVEEARKAGLDWHKLQRMTETTNAMTTRRLQKIGILGALAILCIAAAFFGARTLASSRRRSAARSPA